MLMSLNGYRHQGELRHKYKHFGIFSIDDTNIIIKMIIYDCSRRSAFLRWLTVTFLFVNLVACLALITLIYDQNEMMKKETTPTQQLVLSNTNTNNNVYKIPVKDFILKDCK